MSEWPFGDLKRGHYGAILADPPWHFQPWVGGGGRWNGDKHKRVYTPARAPAYDTMSFAPRREHSRKPDGIHERIERLVAGPYVELFARQRRPGWDAWGNQVDKFEAVA